MGAFARKVLGLQRRETAAPRNEGGSKQAARQVLDTWDMPYFLKLMAQWELIAAMPVEVDGDMAKLAEKVGRQNCIRELVIQLKKEKETADRILAQDMERQRQP
ncbi:MAG: hypothetical protein ACYTAN_13530 [Planctomycetota bacterium]|jgi:hypothetical protein